MRISLDQTSCHAWPDLSTLPSFILRYGHNDNHLQVKTAYCYFKQLLQKIQAIIQLLIMLNIVI